MEWSVAVFGEISFPAGGVQKWKELVVDPERYTDWVEEFAGEACDGSRVAEVLDEIRDLPGGVGAAGPIAMDIGARRVTVRAFPEESGYRDYAPRLATLFRVAADAGGQGDVYFVNAAGLYAYRVHLEKGASAFQQIRDRKGIDGLRAQEAFAEAVALKVAPPRETSLGQAASGVDQAAYERLVALVEKAPAAALEKVLQSYGGLTLPGAKKPLLRAAEVLPVLRRGETEGVRRFAGELAWALDPAGLEPIALELLQRGADIALADLAATALRTSRRPEAREALIEALFDPRQDPFSCPRATALDSLRAQVDADLAERVLARLTRDRAEKGGALVVTSLLDLLRLAAVTPAPEVLEALDKRPEPAIGHALDALRLAVKMSSGKTRAPAKRKAPATTRAPAKGKAPAKTRAPAKKASVKKKAPGAKRAR